MGRIFCGLQLDSLPKKKKFAPLFARFSCMTLSVIIPTYNEAPSIAGLIQSLRQHDPRREVEILVVDAHSPDGTAEVARRAGATVLLAPKPGRAAQMNLGAARATGEVLYFVHADVGIHPTTWPPSARLWRGATRRAATASGSIRAIRCCESIATALVLRA